MTEVMKAPLAWGALEEEEEEDIALPLPEEYLSASPNSRVRFNKNRKVVRYPSEQSLMLTDEVPSTTVIDDDDDFDDNSGDNVQEEEVQEETVEEEQETPKQESTEPTTNAVAPTVAPPISILKQPEVNNDTQPQEKKGWAQRAQVQRYVPRFAPPPPQPEENNDGEDEEEDDDEEGGEDDEDGYDSVVEDEDATEPADDPIKKIAEETIISRQQKLQAVQQQQPQQEQEQEQPVPAPASPKRTEQEAMLKTISHIKDQLRDEVEKAEQASKAVAAAAQQASESNAQLASKVANMRSFLAVLCGCGVRIVGMLVAAKLLDTAATQMRHTRAFLSASLLPSLCQTPPLSPHLAVGTSVSLTHALLRHFLPRLRWRWLAGIDGTVGALVSICSAALGGARGGRILGSAMAAGCIVGIIAASSSYNCEAEFSGTKQTKTISKQQDTGGE